MRKLSLTLLASAGALIASSAYAADEIPLGDSPRLLHQVGVVCRGDGQCWLARDGRRATITDGYYVSPRYYDDNDRGYYWRPGDGPGFRFGISPD